MKKVTPFLWFNNNAGEALEFYTKVFQNSRIISVNKAPDGTFFTGSIEIEGQTIHVMNGGPHYELSPAFSLVIRCHSQEEVEYYWQALTTNGKESMCGWCIDPYGVSWQVIPDLLMELISHKDKAAASRATQAMLKMKKIDCDALQKAFDNR